ncbi:MAG: DUF1800 domain-containing protein [Pirellulaceae bacterium]
MSRRDIEKLWESRESESLTNAEAAHLYRRAAFGATSGEIKAATNEALGAVVDRMLDDAVSSEGAQLEKNFQQMKSVVIAGNIYTQLPAWWLYRLIHTSRPALEQMVLFWHGHFATSAAKVQSPTLLLRQNEAFRRHALGSFTDLVMDVSRDPAMLLYLDSATNRRNRPNENYARELLELFCLGVGHYTEKDIKELARAFTGWELRGETFQFNRFQHDPGEKKLLGKTGIESGEQAIEVIIQSPQTARFIARKLVRYFVSDGDDIGDDLIEPLAQSFRENGFQLRAGLRKLFTSRLFYSELSIGRKIRSPVDMAVGLLRTLQATTNTISLAESTRELGQSLFFPPNVKGWDGGRQWINSATLIGRINLVTKLLGPETTFKAGSSEKIDSAFGVQNATEAVGLAESLLLARVLNGKQKSEVVQKISSEKPERSNLLAAIKVLATMAEFQLA